MKEVIEVNKMMLTRFDLIVSNIGFPEIRIDFQKETAKGTVEITVKYPIGHNEDISRFMDFRNTYNDIELHIKAL